MSASVRVRPRPSASVRVRRIHKAHNTCAHIPKRYVCFQFSQQDQAINTERNISHSSSNQHRNISHSSCNTFSCVTSLLKLLQHGTRTRHFGTS